MSIDLSFTAAVQDVDIDGIAKYLKAGAGIDVQLNKPEATVKYELEPEARCWGIKGIMITVSLVTADINWYVTDDELTEEEIAILVAAGGCHYANGNIEGTINIDSRMQFNSKEWLIESELKFKEDGALMIENVLINLVENTIKIS